MTAIVVTAVGTTGTETGETTGAAVMAADGIDAEDAHGTDAGITAAATIAAAATGTTTVTVIPTADPDATMTAEEIVNKGPDFFADIG